MIGSAFIYKHECPSRKGGRVYADNIFIVKPLEELWEGQGAGGRNVFTSIKLN
jgi:hypothetical protein